MKQTIERQIAPALLGLTFSFGFAGMSAPAATPDQNCPQWRGPLQNGVAPSANPPATWSETNNVKWKVKIPGNGQATPIIWEDRVFIQTAIPTGKKVEPSPAEAGEQTPTVRPESGSPPGENRGEGGRPGGGRGRGGGQKPTEFHQFGALCLDRQTGKVLWQQIAREEVPHEGYRQNEGSFASSSGLTDGQHFFAHFGSRGLYCYDLDGTPRWNQELGKMRIAMGFGEGSSPTLYKETLIVNWDNEDGSFIVALNKNTGRAEINPGREDRADGS